MKLPCFVLLKLDAKKGIIRPGVAGNYDGVGDLLIYDLKSVDGR